MTIYILGIAHCLGCRFAGVIHTEADSPLNLGSDGSKIDELSEFSTVVRRNFTVSLILLARQSHVSQNSNDTLRGTVTLAVLPRDTTAATTVLRFIQKVTHQS